MIFSEDDLIKEIIINKNNFDKVKELCEKFSQEVLKNNEKSFSQYMEDDTLINLINNNVSYDILKYLIDLIGEDIKYYFVLLFHCIEYKNFKLANLLLEKNVNINETIDYEMIQYIHGEESDSSDINEEDELFGDFDEKKYNNVYYFNNFNIIEYLIRIKSLDEEKLNFILKKGNVKLISSTVLVTLTYDNQIDFLNIIFNSNFLDSIFINEIILDRFLIGCYKNKNRLSNKHIKNILRMNRDKEFINFFLYKGHYITKYAKKNRYEYPIVAAIETKNLKIFKLYLNYAQKYKFIIKLCNERIISSIMKTNQRSMLLLLIEYAKNSGIDINKNICNQRSIFLAFKQNKLKIVKLLMSNVKDTNSLNGNSLLICAIENNSIHAVELLIHFAREKKLSLDVTKWNDNGDFALLMAAKKKKYSIYTITNKVCQ